MDHQGKQSHPTPGGERTVLAGELPLATPYLIQIFPFYGCNLHCGFCLHGLPKQKHGFLSERVSMDLELYRKCIDEICEFPGRPKMLRFAAIGEPLLHREITEMVRYAKKAQAAESIDIVTNGVALTRELSDQLTAAGLSRLRVSIEGLCSEDYEEHCGVRIDFQKLIENLRYFYEHKGDTRVYIKIIDYMVKEEAEKKRFYELFSGSCDEIAIEHLTPTVEGIDYDTVSGGMETDKPHNGKQLLHTEICPQGFYMMQINPDGKVVPCCSMKYPDILGDVRENTVQEIWNGENYRRFRCRMLQSLETAGPVCASCKLYYYDLHEEDRLDEERDRLKKLFCKKG